MATFIKKLAKELLAGELYEGESSTAGTVGNIVVGFIPIVGQVADIRDTVASVKEVKNNPASIAGWVGLGIAVFCFIPGTDFLKGFKKGAKKALGNGNWKVFFKPSNNWTLLRKGHSKTSRLKYGVENIFKNDKPFKDVSGQYWRQSGGANGNSLQHLFAQNNTKKIHQKWRNAGINLLEVPAGFNSWMGGHNRREFTFRAIVSGILLGSGYAGYKLGSTVMNAKRDSEPFNKTNCGYNKAINIH